MIRAELNNVRSQRLKDVQHGDMIWIHFQSNLSAAVVGCVLAVRENRIRVKVHSAEGNLKADQLHCLAWDVVIPWSSIGFIRHCETRPVGCACVGDES